MKAAPNLDILPMACVGLILVLVMMMISPMVVSHTRTPVDVPEAHTGQREVQNDISIILTKTGQYLFDDEPVATLEEVGSLVAAQVARDPYVLVVIRADKQCYGNQVLDVLSAAKKAGAARIVCATKKLTIKS
ncbi:biopolymer transporter ExbD [candidate division WOR-3 bacterium]|uniref:Biopolymer transporter ExbD n=1 Tax=candidate division WOR-3 bacterium TaxID=2052148 RepID=A0A937XG21_UNCW3|nr:biopolymer transporter ExbD [candidate division WOR-3 bacterium]